MATKPNAGTLKDIQTALVSYAKQETVEPLKSLGRYLAFGLAGAAAMALAVLFLSLGVLRFLQEETGGAFDGNWSFAPYGITLLIVGAAIAVIGAGLNRVRRENLGGGKGRTP